MEEPSKPAFTSALVAWALVVLLAMITSWTAELYFLSRAEVRVLAQEKQLAELDARAARNELEAERLVNRRERADAAHVPAPARP